MASSFRPSSPADAAEIVALAGRVLGVGQGDPMFAAPHLHWKYWAAWRGSPLARSHVLVRDDRIVAHAGVLPLAYRARGRTLTLLHPFDWMSEPTAIGSGAALLQRLAKLADGLLIVGGSAMTQRIVRPLGFCALGEVTSYAAPITRDTIDATALESDGIECLALTTGPTPDDCDGARPAAPWLMSLATAERLSDCLTCPAAPSCVYIVRRAGARLGGFVLTLAPRQARITAWWSRSPDAFSFVLRAVRQKCAALGEVDEVVCMANVPAERDALVAAGFQATGVVPAFLLSSARELSSGAQIGFQMIDGDVAFLHHGLPEPWLSAGSPA